MAGQPCAVCGLSHPTPVLEMDINGNQQYCETYPGWGFRYYGEDKGGVFHGDGAMHEHVDDEHNTFINAGATVCGSRTKGWAAFADLTFGSCSEDEETPMHMSERVEFDQLSAAVSYAAAMAGDVFAVAKQQAMGTLSEFEALRKDYVAAKEKLENARDRVAQACVACAKPD